jgi:hypothetical protein
MAVTSRGIDTQFLAERPHRQRRQSVLVHKLRAGPYESLLIEVSRS